jgi:hypothetical protein
MDFKSPTKEETEEMEFNQKANELKQEILDEQQQAPSIDLSERRNRIKAIKN